MLGKTDDAAAALLLASAPPWVPAPRAYIGNMCGIHIPNLPVIPGGCEDPTLFLSWFYDRYSPEWQAVIRDAYRAAGNVDWLVSWPDSQAIGKTPQEFRAMCVELRTHGFRPAVMFSAKPTSSDDIRSVEETLANILLVLPLLVGVIQRGCIGWELSLWLSPSDVQFLIDAITPLLLPSGCKTYVHFQAGYFAYQQPGHDTCDFWIPNVGKLTGIFRQRNAGEDGGNKQEYQYRVKDCLDRFAGADGYPTDGGFGHPFDLIELEITAEEQYNPPFMSTTEGDRWGDAALATPPTRDVRVMGSGNGATQ